MEEAKEEEEEEEEKHYKDYQINFQVFKDFIEKLEF